MFISKNSSQKTLKICQGFIIFIRANLAAIIFYTPCPIRYSVLHLYRDVLSAVKSLFLLEKAFLHTSKLYQFSLQALHLCTQSKKIRHTSLEIYRILVELFGAGSRGRTDTVLLPSDFESDASANSTIPAWRGITTVLIITHRFKKINTFQK